MSEAGLSFETATTRGEGRECFWAADVMRVRMEERFAVRSEARWGEMGIFMSVGEEVVPLVGASMVSAIVHVASYRVSN